jgi:hypothetical protein
MAFLFHFFLSVFNWLSIFSPLFLHGKSIFNEATYVYIVIREYFLVKQLFFLLYIFFSLLAAREERIDIQKSTDEEKPRKRYNEK